MRFYKLRVTPNATEVASKFNEQFKPEIIQEFNDPFRIDWILETPADQDILVGDKANLLRFLCRLQWRDSPLFAVGPSAGGSSAAWLHCQAAYTWGTVQHQRVFFCSGDPR
jgi:hypothetical protein